MQSKMTLKEWLPLLGITVSAFIFNTSEFMPIGLLTDIADSFHITEAHAGVLITVYSWIVMLLSLPLMLLLNKIDFKRLLLGTIALLDLPDAVRFFCFIWNVNDITYWRSVYTFSILVDRITGSSQCCVRKVSFTCT